MTLPSMTTRDPRRLLLLAAVVSATMLGVFVLPYFFHVVPTVSMSYPTLFNNRVAWCSFVLGALLIGVALRGNLGPMDTNEDRLPQRVLWMSVLLAVFLPLAIRWVFGVKYGFETELFLDRMRQLSLGRVPFREFEFAYGPLLLYPPVILSRLLHVSPVVGYFACQCLFSALGMAMLYFIVQQIDLPAAPRRAVYALACIHFPALLLNEGLNYQPLRPLTTPFVCICVFWVWQRRRDPYLTAVAACVAIVIGFEVSAEQGMGLLLGMPAWILLLTFRNRVFPLGAMALHVALTAAIYVAVLKAGWLLAMQSFSVGGNNFPILFSPWNLAVLALYTCGFVLLWRAIAQRDVQHNYVLLILCGIGVLPSAMGRCDATHLIAASSLYIVSLMAAQSRRPLRRTIVLSLWILLPIAFYGVQASTLYRRVQQAGWHPRPVSAAAVIPRDRVYYSPFSTAVSPATYHYVGFPIDEGFFAGFENVMTEAQVQQVLHELEQRKGQPIVLPLQWDREPRVAIWDTNTRFLRRYEVSFYYPSAKRPPIDTTMLSHYVLRHYRPTNLVEDERRVWEYIPGS